MEGNTMGWGAEGRLEQWALVVRSEWKRPLAWKGAGTDGTHRNLPKE